MDAHGRVNSLRRLRIALEFGVDSVDGTYLLHESKRGRPEEAPHDVVGWLRQIHIDRRLKLRRGLERLGAGGETVDALMSYHN